MRYILMLFYILIKIFIAVMIEINLPNKKRTLKSNLNFRRNVYAICRLIDFFLSLACTKIFTPSSYWEIKPGCYFAISAVIAICLFAVLYPIDKKTTKKLENYCSANIDEYNEYKKLDTNDANWSAFYCTLINTLYAMLPILVLLG